MSTRTAYYLVQNQTYAPINIIPSNLVKCTHCDHYVQYTQMKSHAQLHIPPKYSMALSHQNNKHRISCSKLKIQHIIDEDVFAKQHEDISVKSFLPEEMPTPDIARKEAIKAPTPILSLCKSNQNPTNQRVTLSEITGFDFDSNSQNPDELDVNSRFTQQQFQPQIHQTINFKKQVQYLTKNFENKYKKINKFENRNMENMQKGTHIDNIEKLSKKQELKAMNILKQQKQNINEVYIVEACKEKSNSKVPVKVQIKSNNRSPLTKQKISTVSTSGTGFFKGPKLSNFFGNQSDSSQQTRNNVSDIPNLRLQSNLQCGSCKGFYCKECGSDIPPIYRPVPTNLDINNHPTQETRSFYASHVYSHKNGKTSRVTHCTNCE